MYSFWRSEEEGLSLLDELRPIFDVDHDCGYELDQDLFNIFCVFIPAGNLAVFFLGEAKMNNVKALRLDNLDA